MDYSDCNITHASSLETPKWERAEELLARNQENLYPTSLQQYFWLYSQK
jgi:hypothetical protein